MLPDTYPSSGWSYIQGDHKRYGTTGSILPEPDRPGLSSRVSVLLTQFSQVEPPQETLVGESSIKSENQHSVKDLLAHYEPVVQSRNDLRRTASDFF